MAETLREDADRILANRWMPPGGDPGDPVACLATTYSFDVPYFENILLPRFLGLELDADESGKAFLVEREAGLGLANVAVLVNAEHYDRRQASRRWLQLPVRVRGGMLHAKACLLVWENHIRVLVSSANLTRYGYRRNREVAVALDFFDAAEAAPRRLLTDVLSFLRHLRRSGWIRCGDEGLARVDEAITAADAIQRRWKGLRDEARPRDLPRVALALTMPGPNGHGVARSCLDTVAGMWGTRRATRVAVVTPFVGEPAESAEDAVRKLRLMFPGRLTKGDLVVPGHEHDGETWTALPQSFRDAWCRHFSGPGNEPAYYVIKPRRQDDEAARPLHAKALVVESEEHVLVLCGSSNFSIHGMGIRLANVEANLCFLDERNKRKRTTLADRIGVDWEEDLCLDPRWPLCAEPDEEDALKGEASLPLYFLWARHDEVQGMLLVAVDARQPAPLNWEISLLGHDGGIATPIARQHAAVVAEDGTITIAGDHLLGPVTAVSVTWDDPGVEQRSALLPVQVEAQSEARDDLLDGFTARTIILCLACGFEPQHWLARRQDGRNPHGNNDDDAHKQVDTSGYALYRVRQLGQALAVLARRILDTPRHLGAIRYRLFQDPLSPVNLSRALKDDWREGVAAESDAVLAFALAEIRLTVAHVFAKLPAKSRRELRTLFVEALATIGAPPGAEDPASSLRDYVKNVDQKCRQLVEREDS